MRQLYSSILDEQETEIFQLNQYQIRIKAIQSEEKTFQITEDTDATFNYTLVMI